MLEVGIAASAVAFPPALVTLMPLYRAVDPFLPGSLAGAATQLTNVTKKTEAQARAFEAASSLARYTTPAAISSGVDPRAVLRAVWDNLTHGRRLEGASTIAMQVARMQSPGPRSFAQKIREAATGLAL